MDENDKRITDARAEKAVDGKESFSRAVRNSFVALRDKKYKLVEAYKTDQAYRGGIIIIYELGDGVDYTTIDKISYGIIVKHTINEYMNRGDEGFPVFPAPDPDWFKDADTISLKKRPPVYQNLCDSRFARFAFAPFPSKVLQEELKADDVQKRLKEYMEDAKWKPYYDQAFAYTKQYGGIPDGAKEVEKKIISAWCEYAKFLAKLLS